MRRWSVGAKIMVASVVGMLLGFGLCGISGGGVSGGTSLGGVAEVGTMLFVFSMIGFMVGAVVWFVGGITKDDR